MRKKWCNTCKSWKDRSEFGVLTRAKDGLKSNCRVCCQTFGKDYNHNKRAGRPRPLEDPGLPGTGTPEWDALPEDEKWERIAQDLKEFTISPPSRG